MPAPIRRVVTGKDATGKAIVMIDSAAGNIRERKETGVANTLLWVTDAMPTIVTLPIDTADRKIGVHPPPNGTVFRVVEFLPEKEVRADYESRLRLMPEGDTHSSWISAAHDPMAWEHIAWPGAELPPPAVRLCPGRSCRLVSG